MKIEWFELSCEKSSRLLSEAQERRLALPEQIKLHLHLLACGGCNNFRKQLHFIRAFIRGHRDVDFRR